MVCDCFLFLDHSILILRKTYQENYPGSSTYCATLEYSADYKYCRKHNPYMSYININRNLTRCARIVNSAELDTDLDRGTLPQYSFFTPNLDNDAHEYVVFSRNRSFCSHSLVLILRSEEITCDDSFLLKGD